MDEEEHRRQLRSLNKRVDAAGDRIFDAAQRLLDEVHGVEERKLAEDTLTAWWERRTRLLADYVGAVTETTAAWGQETLRVYAQRPTTAWRQRRQRQRMRSIAKTLERAAKRLESTRP